MVIAVFQNQMSIQFWESFTLSATVTELYGARVFSFVAFLESSPTPISVAPNESANVANTKGVTLSEVSYLSVTLALMMSTFTSGRVIFGAELGPLKS